MKRFSRWLPLRPSWLICGGLLLAAPCGCHQAADVDRAADDDESDIMPRRKTQRESASRTDESRGREAFSSYRDGGNVLTFAEDPVADEPPLSESIATPLPIRSAAMPEAEYDPRGTNPATRIVSAAMPQPYSAPPPAFDVGAALRQAEELNRRGAASVAKGAWFTGRTEFLTALQQIAAALDAQEGRTHRSAALTAGLTALTEAEAFTGRNGANPAAVSTVLATHRTAPFVGPFPAGVSPVALREAYLRFATERLAESVAGAVAGSTALHGLGKIHNAADSTLSDGRAKARAFYEASLAVGPGNFLAANDLAVLLAEEGRLEQARDLLHAALRQSPQPALWNNLAAVHDRLGQTDLAQRARHESASLERRAAAAPGSVLPTHNVAWLDPRSFAATSRSASDTTAAVPTNGGAVRPASAAAPAPAGKPMTGVAQRPVNRALAY